MDPVPSWYKNLSAHHFHAAMVREGSRLMKQEGEWGVEGEEQEEFRERDK